MEQMKLTIATRDEALEAIDEIGARMERIEVLNTEIATLKGMFEDWFRKNPEEPSSGETDLCSFEMKPKARALKMAQGVSLETVLEKLKGDEGMAQYVFEGYDAKKLKKDFGGNAAKRESLAAYGLTFTNPTEKFLTVERLKG